MCRDNPYHYDLGFIETLEAKPTARALFLLALLQHETKSAGAGAIVSVFALSVFISLYSIDNDYL